METLPLLAEATEVMTKQINEMYVWFKDADIPSWIVWAILYLSAATVILAIFLFLRQKKIAQNQVDLAKILQELIEK